MAQDQTKTNGLKLKTVYENVVCDGGKWKRMDYLANSDGKLVHSTEKIKLDPYLTQSPDVDSRCIRNQNIKSKIKI